jgi:hypothetical protein
MPDFVLQDDQNVNVAVQVGDGAGNIVPGTSLDPGSVTATVSDPEVLSATVSPDQSSVNISALGPIGTDVTVTVAGTLGGEPLSGDIAIDVTDSPAASIILVAGTPQTNTPA